MLDPHSQRKASIYSTLKLCNLASVAITYHESVLILRNPRETKKKTYI